MGAFRIMMLSGSCALNITAARIMCQEILGCRDDHSRLRPHGPFYRCDSTSLQQVSRTSSFAIHLRIPTALDTCSYDEHHRRITPEMIRVFAQAILMHDIAATMYLHLSQLLYYSHTVTRSLPCSLFRLSLRRHII